MRFINSSVHAILDYLVDITLVSIPLLFDFSSVSLAALYVPVAIGLTNLVYSLFTVYSGSLYKLISFRLHLVFDFSVGIILVITPYIAAIDGFPKIFLIVMGLGIMGATAFTNPKVATN